MVSKLRLPSPALVVAVVALFVALGGTAVAAGVVPLAKRALISDNAKKVEGKTSAQIVKQAVGEAVPQAVSQAGQQPGPASTAAGLVATKNVTASLAADQGQEFLVACDAGKAVGGGWSTTGAVLAFDSRPMSDTTWGVYLANMSPANAANITVYAVCLK
jgi:hypothetical protein